MFAEFTYQPLSGCYQEIIFDAPTIWGNASWCWVKFIYEDGEEWIGCFRGMPLKLALNNFTNRVGVLTSTCFFVIDPFTKKIVYLEEQTDYNDLIAAPDGTSFIAASFYGINVIDGLFKVESLKIDNYIEDIKFLNYDGDLLMTEFELIDNQYQRNTVIGYVDTNNYKIVI